MFKLNELCLGDCLKVMKDIDDKSVDMILCDLPYGLTACKWDSVISLEMLWEQYKRIVKGNAAIVLTACQPFTSALVISNLKMFKYEWIWVKSQGVDPFMSKYRPLNNIENIPVFSQNKTIYNPQMIKGRPYKIIRDKKPRVKEHNKCLMKQTETDNKGERFPVVSAGCTSAWPARQTG